ncbi:MAG: replication-associated recombination protein A [Bacteroidota bacterium]|nr:replication-associated recombination protein A [Bacteroidota bacterium]
MQNDFRPLAERMRPRETNEVFGQEHLLGEGAPLFKAIHSGNIPSMILWGPPGVGKTSIARLIANSQNRQFHSLSAINSGVKEVRKTIEMARKNRMFNPKPPLLFIDEIHRFSKSQQDSLLSAVEDGTLVLIGATTENPSFEVITPLLSRSQVYVLNPLDENALDNLIARTLSSDKQLRDMSIEIKEKDALYRFSGGDARKLLNILEIMIQTSNSNNIIIDNAGVEQNLQENIAIYDKAGEQHYDIISAFIKSVRGSSPDAAIYWLARMIDGGEKPEFIARRLIILAAEDIGLANPNALQLANACFDSVHKIGMPEARIILSECTIYLAVSAKSNSAYVAINKALDLVKKEKPDPVPLHLRNAPTKLMKDLGYGKDYRYVHDYPGNFIKQSYLPNDFQSVKFYIPGNNQTENKINERLTKIWK